MVFSRKVRPWQILSLSTSPMALKKLCPVHTFEFAQRLVLPQFKNLPDSEVKENHRRDGFEVGNADSIFESTSKEQLNRRAA